MKMHLSRLILGSAFVLITIIGFFLTIHDSVFTAPPAPDLNLQAIPALSIVLHFYSGMYTVIPIILFLMMIPWVSHYRTFLWKKEGFDDQIALRKGKKRVLWELLMDSVRQIWMYPVLINFVLCLLIVLFTPRYPLVTDSWTYFYYVDNLILDLIVFTLLQTIGWSILNLLCYLAAEFVNNAYLYPFVLLLGSLAITFVVSWLSGIPWKENWIFSALSPVNLLAPGVIVLLTPPTALDRLLTVVLSFALYGILFAVLYQKMKKRRMYYG